MAEEVRNSRILTLLSRAVGLDVGYFLKSGSWVALRYGLVSLFGLILSIAFARLASKELLGQYQSVLALVALVSVFSLPGLNLAALKAVTEGRKTAVLQAVRYSFLASLLGVPVLIGYGAWVALMQGNDTIALAWLLAGAFFPFFYAPNTWYVFYEARSLFAPVSLRVILVSFLTALGVIGALYFKGSLLLLLALYFGINAFFNWLFFLEVRKKIQKEEQQEKEVLDIRYGLSVTLQKFVFSLAENLPVLAVSFLFGFEALALFQIAYFFMNAVAGFLSGLSATYLPFLFRYQSFNYGKIILQNLVIGVILFILFRVFLALFFILFYGSGYQESLKIAEALSFLIILYPLKTFFINFLTAQQKNTFIVLSFVFANSAALLVFLALKNASLLTGVSWYLYLLNLLLIIPFAGIYFFIASRKTDSSFSPMRS